MKKGLLLKVAGNEVRGWKWIDYESPDDEGVWAAMDDVEAAGLDPVLLTVEQIDQIAKEK